MLAGGVDPGSWGHAHGISVLSLPWPGMRSVEPAPQLPYLITRAESGCMWVQRGPAQPWQRDKEAASPGISRATSGQAVWLLWLPGTEAPCHEPGGQGL